MKASSFRIGEQSVGLPPPSVRAAETDIRPGSSRKADSGFRARTWFMMPVSKHTWNARRLRLAARCARPHGTFGRNGNAHPDPGPAPRDVDGRRRPRQQRLLHPHARAETGQEDRQLRCAGCLSSLLRQRRGHAWHGDDLFPVPQHRQGACGSWRSLRHRVCGSARGTRLLARQACRGECRAARRQHTLRRKTPRFHRAGRRRLRPG